MLDDARKKAPTILQKADSFNRSRKLHEAIAVIKAIHTGPTAEEQNILVQLADFLSAGWPSTDYVLRRAQLRDLRRRDRCRRRLIPFAQTVFPLVRALATNLVREAAPELVQELARLAWARTDDAQTLKR